MATVTQLLGKEHKESWVELVLVTGKTEALDPFTHQKLQPQCLLWGLKTVQASNTGAQRKLQLK